VSAGTQALRQDSTASSSDRDQALKSELLKSLVFKTQSRA
jgi:very-short-patch-repair endonuclease